MSTVIVGAGLAGLYYAFLSGKSNITILEQSDRIGGRVGQIDFHGVNIVYGAGIGRYNKDVLLKKLLEDLKVEYKTYTTQITYKLPKVVDILKSCSYLLGLYDPAIRSNTTFVEFLRGHLKNDREVYNWICSSGYSDYLQADVYDTLTDYGFDDNVGGYKAMSIQWNELLLALSRKLKARGVKIQLNHTVTQIVKSGTKIVVTTNKGEYKCKKVILAVPSPCIRRLLKNPIYRDVRTQEFCRLYIKIDQDLSRKFVENVKGFIFLEPPLQKIISFDKGVYMISYSDNKSARYVKDLNEKELENLIHESTGYNVKILDKLVFYFEMGTHYYKPLDTSLYRGRDDFLSKAQMPEEGIYVVGEGFSKNQGWCEGALESVMSVL